MYPISLLPFFFLSVSSTSFAQIGLCLSFLFYRLCFPCLAARIVPVLSGLLSCIHYRGGGLPEFVARDPDLFCVCSSRQNIIPICVVLAREVHENGSDLKACLKLGKTIAARRSSTAPAPLRQRNLCRAKPLDCAIHASSLLLFYIEFVQHTLLCKRHHSSPPSLIRVDHFHLRLRVFLWAKGAASLF